VVAFITVLADEWLVNGANLNDNKKAFSSYLLLFYATSIKYLIMCLQVIILLHKYFSFRMCFNVICKLNVHFLIYMFDVDFSGNT
jgi:hypothetical protein